MTSNGFYAFRSRRIWVWMLISMLILAGYPVNQNQDALHGRVTLWHSWSPAEATVLEAAEALTRQTVKLLSHLGP